MRNIQILVMPFISGASAFAATPRCGPDCSCNPLPTTTVDILQLMRDTIHQLDIELDIDIEHDQEPVPAPKWDDSHIVMFSSSELNELLDATMPRFTGHEIHQFLNTVDPLSEKSTNLLDDTRYDELIDQVKGAMSVLERNYNGVINNGGDHAEGVVMVQFMATSLITTYRYNDYVIYTALVNTLAKIEMDNHG